MQFLRKRLILLLVITVIYAVFFLTHLHPNANKNVLGTSANLVLFEEPQNGKDPIISAINNAQKEIDVEVYLLSDKEVIASLESACQRGVVVKVMLEEHPFGGGNINPKTKQEFDSSCVHTVWSNPAFSLTHEKTMLIDGQEVLILSQNLTNAAFTTNREYDIFDGNALDIQEIQKIFNADWNRSSVDVSDENLVVSPVNSRDKLETFIASAKTQISIEMEVVDDPEIVGLLEQEAKSKTVQIVIPSFSQVSSNKKVAVELQQSGVKIKTMSKPYVHAKLVIADGVKAYVGSVNFTTQSMDSNREVGIIISQQDIVTQLTNDFATDWDSALSLQ